MEPVVPAGPTVHENHDKAAPAPTYEDMIRTSHDEALFDYYFTSQLAAIDTTTGRRTADRPAGDLRNRDAVARRSLRARVDASSGRSRI